MLYFQNNRRSHRQRRKKALEFTALWKNSSNSRFLFPFEMLSHTGADLKQSFASGICLNLKSKCIANVRLCWTAHMVWAEAFHVMQHALWRPSLPFDTFNSTLLCFFSWGKVKCVFLLGDFNNPLKSDESLAHCRLPECSVFKPFSTRMFQNPVG